MQQIHVMNTPTANQVISLGGGGIMQQIRKSYSLSDLSECDPRNERSADEADDVLTEPRAPRQVKGRYNTRRSASEASRSMYFPEMDLDVRSNRSSRSDEPDFSHIKSTEDISSGYSSAENPASLARTASVGAAGRTRSRTTRTTVTAIKRPSAAEDNEGIIEELQDDDAFEYSNMPALVNVKSQLYLSHTDPPFLYQYVGNQVRVIQMLSDNPLVINNINPTVNTDCYDESEATFEDASAAIDLNSEYKRKPDLPKNNYQINEAFGEHIKENIQHITDIEEPIEIQNKSGSLNINHDKQNTDVFQTSTKHLQVQHTENFHKINEKVSRQALEEQNVIKATCTEPSYYCKLNKEQNTFNQSKENTNNTLEQDAIPTTPSVAEPQKGCESDRLTQSSVDKIFSFAHKTVIENSCKEYAEIYRKVEPETTILKVLDSGDSDDEVSFGTPEESPKNKRKSPKGKYGKGKAPPPPALDKIEQVAGTVMQIKEIENKFIKSYSKDIIFIPPQHSTNSKDSENSALPALDKIEQETETITQIKENENKYDHIDIKDNIFVASQSNANSKDSGKVLPPPALDKIVQAAQTIMKINETETKFNKSDSKDNIFVAHQPNTNSKGSGRKNLLDNPITEKKRRNKSKSPARIYKDSSTGIGKLLQLPGKLAFWNKTEESKKSKDRIPTTDDQSKNSSTIDSSFDELHDSAVEIVSNYESNVEDVQSIADDALSFQDATDLNSEVISHELIEKSDALQRLIEAKIESHPEYKLVSLHSEIPTSSKSTDV